MLEVIIKVPFKLMELTDYIHTNCEILKTNYQENEAVFLVRTKKDSLIFLKNKGAQIQEVWAKKALKIVRKLFKKSWKII